MERRTEVLFSVMAPTQMAGKSSPGVGFVPGDLDHSIPGYRCGQHSSSSQRTLQPAGPPTPSYSAKLVSSHSSSHFGTVCLLGPTPFSFSYLYTL